MAEFRRPEPPNPLISEPSGSGHIILGLIFCKFGSIIIFSSFLVTYVYIRCQFVFIFWQLTHFLHFRYGLYGRRQTWRSQAAVCDRQTGHRARYQRVVQETGKYFEYCFLRRSRIKRTKLERANLQSVRCYV